MIIYFDNKKENLLSIDSGFLKLLGLPTKKLWKVTVTLPQKFVDNSRDFFLFFSKQRIVIIIYFDSKKENLLLKIVGS